MRHQTSLLPSSLCWAAPCRQPRLSFFGKGRRKWEFHSNFQHSMVAGRAGGASPPGKGGWGGHRSLFNPISRNKYGILKQAGNPNPAFPRCPLFLSPLEGGVGYVQTQPQQSRRAQGWGWELWSSPHPWSSSSSPSSGRKGSAKSQGHAVREPPCPIPSKFGIVFEKNGERVTPGGLIPMSLPQTQQVTATFGFNDLFHPKNGH